MGGMGGTLLLSVRRHAYQNGEAASVHQNLEQLEFVLFQNKSYNYITRLGLNQPEKNDRAQCAERKWICLILYSHTNVTAAPRN